MNRKLLFSLLAPFLLPAVLHAAVVTPLHDGWRLQSACKLEAGGEAIAVAGFPVEGWLKTTVPSTVLAAQVAAGSLPDPYFGDNLRKIPGTDYPIGQVFSNLPMSQDSPYRCGWWYRNEFTAPAAAKDARALLAALWRHQLPRRNLAQRPPDRGFDAGCRRLSHL